ncbi:MAG TPA: hypothetical protein VL371_24120 [Gemmataceae bacterium]|nr:hypothetical protein [Gemmataceae bacterium]
MNSPALTVTSATGKIRPELAGFLASLKAGQRIKLTQSIRVGARKWTTTTTGVYRGLDYLATGLATQRVPEDDIVVPVLHFTKDNGELSSISLDEHTKVELVQ